MANQGIDRAKRADEITVANYDTFGAPVEPLVHMMQAIVCGFGGLF